MDDPGRPIVRRMIERRGIVAILKRWWWVAAAVIVVAVGAMLFIRPGAPASPSVTGQTAGGPGTTTTVTTATSTPGSPSTTRTLDETTTPGDPSDPTASDIKVAAKGSALTTVTDPPERTLAQITYTASRDGQLYDVTFKPYGTGPSRGGHGSVAVLVSEFSPQQSYSDALTLPGNNVLLELGPGVSVTSGGTYTGVVRLMKSGSSLVLVLTSVKPG